MLVLLVSYAGSEDPNAMSINATRRFYALLHLRHLGTFNAEACHSVPYQSVSFVQALKNEKLISQLRHPLPAPQCILEYN